MPLEDNPTTDPKALAEALLAQHGGKWYAAAKSLGDASLRAGLSRLVKEDYPASPRLQDALRRWAHIEPLIIQAQAGSIIFGETGLLAAGQVVAILVMPPDELKAHMIPCAACGEQTVRWSANQRYCPKHSWSTPEGRKWHRKTK